MKGGKKGAISQGLLLWLTEFFGVESVPKAVNLVDSLIFKSIQATE